MGLKRKRIHCVGCEDDFYNDNNQYGIKECWNLKSARIVKKKAIGMNDVPPWNHTPRETLSCYHRKGCWYVDAKRTC